MASQTLTFPHNAQAHETFPGWPCAGAGTMLELAVMVLDRYGTVDNCSAAAARLFGAGMPALLGRHVNSVIPAMPLRCKTPGYNLAYASYWSCHGRYRRFRGIDCRGDSFDIDIQLQRLHLEGRIQLNLREPLGIAQARERWLAPESRLQAPACA